MTEIVLAHGGQSFGDYGTQWLYFLAPFPIAAAAIAYLFASGGSGGFLARVARSLERTTGLPAWSAGGIGMGILALIVAVLGFYWDVAWHIELGRDKFIFTPAHMGILAGLGLIIVAAATSIVLATHTRAETRFSWRGVRIPLSSVPLALLGLGAVSGFPLDEFWHRNYGIDVTMWGPTHLVMISGASLTPIALLLMYVEGRRERTPTRFGRITGQILAAAMVLGLSTWTGEFDFGVPQFQALYHPILVMSGPSLALVCARHFLGAGGALRAALGALVLRGLIAVVVGAGLGLVIPRFPLYIGIALVVEGAFVLTRRLDGARAALATGALVATVGFATEWAWTQVWGRHPWSLDLFPGAVLAAVGAAAAVVIGWAMGRILGEAGTGVPAPMVALAGLVLLFVLAAPLPRNDAQVNAVIETAPTGDRVDVVVELDRSELARDADWFEILSWQGGSVEVTELDQIGPGRYRSAHPVPVTGNWKSVIRLANKDVMVATAVYLPADPEIGASEVPVEPRREVELQEDGQFLLREAREGAAWPALVAYSAILMLAGTWIVSLTLAFRSVNRTPRTPRSRPAVGRTREATA